MTVYFYYWFIIAMVAFGPILPKSLLVSYGNAGHISSWESIFWCISLLMIGNSCCSRLFGGLEQN